MIFTLEDFSKKIGASVINPRADVEISGVATLDSADNTQVSFLSNPKYAKEALTSRAGAIITEKEIPEHNIPQLLVKNAYLGWAMACNLFAPDRSSYFPRNIHPTAIISSAVKMGSDIHIGPYSFIGSETIIGDGCIIHSGAVIEEKCVIGRNTEIHSNAVIHYGTQVGDRCVIWSGAVIGAYGFGYAQDGAKWVTIHQLGKVIIEDDVDIGANATIDRGAVGNTIIRKGAKIDNLVLIAHNVNVGEDSAIAAQSGLAGSVKIGKRVKIAGQAGFVGHIEIGDDSFIGAKAGVSKSFPAKSNITGYPARPIMEVRRSDASLINLPELIKKVSAMEVRLKSLESGQKD